MLRLFRSNLPDVVYHHRDNLLIAITKTSIQKIKIDIQKITVKEKASD